MKSKLNYLIVEEADVDGRGLLSLELNTDHAFSSLDIRAYATTYRCWFGSETIGPWRHRSHGILIIIKGVFIMKKLLLVASLSMLFISNSYAAVDSYLYNCPIIGKCQLVCTSDTDAKMELRKFDKIGNVQIIAIGNAAKIYKVTYPNGDSLIVSPSIRTFCYIDSPRRLVE